MGRNCAGARLKAARGAGSFVNTAIGPTKTSSSRVTLSQTQTPFFTITRSPIRAPPSTNTWPQMLQSAPIRAPFMTWAKAQILVPAPTSSLSQRAFSWTNARAAVVKRSAKAYEGDVRQASGPARPTGSSRPLARNARSIISRARTTASPDRPPVSGLWPRSMQSRK